MLLYSSTKTVISHHLVIDGTIFAIKVNMIVSKAVKVENKAPFLSF